MTGVQTCALPIYPGLWNSEHSPRNPGNPLTIRIQNPNFTVKDWNPVPGIGNPQCGIQNPILSLILLLEASYSIEKSTQGVVYYQEIVLSEFYFQFISRNVAEQCPKLELSRLKPTVLVPNNLRNKITIKLYKRGGSTRLEFAFSSNRKQNLLVGYLSSCCWQVQRGPAIWNDHSNCNSFNKRTEFKIKTTAKREDSPLSIH